MKNSFKNRAHTVIFSHFLERSLIIVLVAMSVSWLVTRNPRQSVLLGLLMLPASYIGDCLKAMQIKQRQQNAQTNLAKEIQGIEIRLMDLENYEEQIYQAISAAQNFNHSLESENQRLRTERFDLSEQISSLQNKQHELVQCCAELNPQKEKLQTKLDELDRKIKAANNQKSEIEKELLEKSYNLKVVENSCTFIHQELERLNQEILEKMQYKENVCRAIKVLEQQIQHAILQSQDLTQKEQALHCTLASLGETENSLTASCQTLQQRLDSLRHEEITLTHLLQDKREEVTALENCLTYLFNEYNVLQDEASEGQSQIAILNEQTTVMSH